MIQLYLLIWYSNFSLNTKGAYLENNSVVLKILNGECFITSDNSPFI